MIFCLFGIHWVMLYKVSKVLASWQGKFGRHRNIGLWRFVPHCFFGAYGGSGILDALRIVNGLFLTLVANLCNAWEISEKCSRNFFFFFFLIHLPLD